MKDASRKRAREKFCTVFGIPIQKNIALYAPTFRSNTDYYNSNIYDLNYNNVLEALSKRFGGEWILLVRYHFKLRDIISPSTQKNVIDVTSYYDMQVLLCAADVGITDYSSWICDYALTDNPGFLYANDIEKYVEERGFYYSLEETPFPICKTNDELASAILNFNNSDFQKKRFEFLKKRGCFETGEGAKRVVDKIIEINSEVE